MSAHRSERDHPHEGRLAGDRHAPPGDERAEPDRLVAPADDGGLPPLSLIGGAAGASAPAAEERAASLAMDLPEDDIHDRDHPQRDAQED